MIGNYLKTGFRTLKRSHLNTGINILGFALAIAWGMLVFCFVQDEYRFDRFHAHIDRLALAMAQYDNGQTRAALGTQAPLGQALKEEYPEFDASARLLKENLDVKQDHEAFKVDMLGTDADFFEMFSFPLAYGTPETFSSIADCIYLSWPMAKRLFGDADALGRRLNIQIAGALKPFEVAGVFKPIPGCSSLQFDMLFNISHLLGEKAVQWTQFRIPLCLRIAPNYDMTEACRRFSEITAPRLEGFNISQYTTYHLQPLQDFHLHNQYYFPSLEGAASPTASLLLAGIALLVLFVASINYINLALGGASRRLREVGVRKVMGAEKVQVLRQFIIETSLIVGFSMALGLLMAQLALPVFNQLTAKNIHVIPLGSPLTWGAMFIMALFVIGLSGVFPALRLSNIQPSALFQGRLKFIGKKRLSGGLIVFQFMVSAFLVCTTLVILNQHRYMLSRHFGSDMDQVIQVKMGELQRSGPQLQGQIRALKNKLLSLPGVVGVSNSQTSVFETMAAVATVRGGENIMVCRNYTDADYLQIMKMKLQEGDLPSPDFIGKSAYVTDHFVKDAVEGDAIGKTLREVLGEGFENIPIVGVIDDFFTQSLKYGNPDHFFVVDNEAPYGVMNIAMDGESIHSTLGDIREAFKEVVPNISFTYEFMDDLAAQDYAEESRWSRIVQISSAVALFIAFSGLFGLTLMAIVRRNKELSIRKVLGASAWHVYGLVQKEFLYLIVIGNVLAFPVVYFVMRDWLNDFAHRTTLSWWIYGVAMLVTLLVAVVTIGIHGVRVNRSNPLVHLRSE